MKLLVIDLGDAPIEAMSGMVPKAECIAVAANAIPENLEDFGGIVVAGAAGAAQPGTELLGDLELSGKPVLGVGAGFEVICSLLGINLTSDYDQDESAAKLVPTEDGAKLFQGSDPMLVEATKRWQFDEVPRGIQILARSESGIEAVRHKQKPLLGLQQLPADFTYASDAKLVYANLYTIFGKI